MECAYLLECLYVFALFCKYHDKVTDQVTDHVNDHVTVKDDVRDTDPVVAYNSTAFRFYIRGNYYPLSLNKKQFILDYILANLVK